MAGWTPYIDQYVDELLRLEGLTAQMECGQIDCTNLVGSSFEGLRCLDCQDPRLFCPGCIVNSHTNAGLPFHRIQVKNYIPTL